jgi:CTP:molybdopterin cytidylyltransferase MocA
MIAAVVLAAGPGERFAGPTHKLRAEIDGVAMVRRCVDAAVASGIGPVLVVSGAEPLGDLLPPGVTEIRALEWSAGQSHSLQAALRSLEPSGTEAVVVGLGDTPGVTAEAWRTVADAEGQIVVATYDGHRRPPVKLARSVWAELPTSGDAGARVLMARRPELVREVSVLGDARDIDTLEDLRSH